MRLCLVAGARPNFVKIAPIIHALRARQHDDWFLVHTGQHYDAKLSDTFFSELNMPVPDESLGVGSGTHAEQTAKVMLGLEPILARRQPDVIVVVGDVNSTLAAVLVASKLGIRIAHVEAGLRSGDRSMPEEINRLVADVLSDVLFTTSEDADENLLREGIPRERIHLVGNVMVDSLLQHLDAARRRDTLQRLNLIGSNGQPIRYAVVTLHRPSNVDAADTFHGLMTAIDHVAQQMPVIFPVHPRTAARIASWEGAKGDVRTMESLPYLDFLALNASASAIFTDSGGLQEEASVLGVPCFTLRENTERPVTISKGTNELVGTNPTSIIAAADRVLNQPLGKNTEIPLWDGRAAERIVDVLLTVR